MPGQSPMPLWLGLAGSAATRARARFGPKVWTARVPPKRIGCRPKAATGEEKEEKEGGHRAGSMPGHTREPQRGYRCGGGVAVVDLTGGDRIG